MGYRHGPILAVLAQGAEHCTLAYSLANALGKQRVVLAQVRPYHQHPLQFRQGSDRHAQMAYAFSRKKFGMAQPMVDVVAAQAAHQSAREHQFFEGAVRADQGAKAASAMVGLDFAQAVSHVFERRLPIHRLPDAALFDHGPGQALVAVQRLVGKAVAIGNPALVDRFILKGYHPHHLVALDLHHEVGTCAVMRADGFTP